MAEPNRVILLDPGFETIFGHHASHNLRFARAFDGLEIVASKNVDPRIELFDAEVTGRFSTSLYTLGTRCYSGRERFHKRVVRALRGKSTAGLVAAFENDLRAIWSERAFSDRDAVIVHSEAPPFTKALAKVLSSLPEDRRPALHIRFTNVDWVCRDVIGAYSALANVVEPQKLNVYVEYESLRAPVAQRFSRAPVGLMRGSIVPCSELPDRVVRSQERERLKVLYFGAPRRERGWHRLPEIAAGLGRYVDFTVHAGTAPEQGGHTGAVIEELRHLGVRVIVDRLSDEDLSRLLADHDVVVLPYDAEEYRLRGSSVALEAVLHACPLVVTEGTVMEDLTQAGNGLSAPVGDFVDAVVQVAQSYDKIAAAAAVEARRAAEWQDLGVLAKRIAYPASAQNFSR